ncbi:hypothetical protein ACFC5Z_32090 [Streptomyces sp. NPDC056004]|uniref:hypothetical protein n=1 Tax=unclassified Streptomyces TaxID=2593676 RepID=UPI0035DC3F26
MSVRLEWLDAKAMDALPSAEARTAVQALFVDAARHPGWWPAPAGEEIAHAFPARPPHQRLGHG